MGRSGRPVFLDPAEADEVMDTLGVRLAVDNKVLIALGKAKNLKCTPPNTVRGQHIGRVTGSAVGNYPWSLIIGRFNFFGTANCSIRKTCRCCNDGSTAYRVHASCTFNLAGNDTYDFHAPVPKLIPGVAYNILWTWQTDAGKSYENKCKDGSVPQFPSVGGGCGSW